MFAGIALAQRRAHSRGAWTACLLLALGACTEPRFTRDETDSEVDVPVSGGPQDAAAEAALPNANGCQPEDCVDATPSGLDAGDAGNALIAPGAADAGEAMALDAGLDPTRMQWAGRWATRSFVFSYDPPVRASARYLTLAEITPSADGGLTLTEELCRFESGFTLITTANLLEDFPPGIRLSSPLTFDDENFSSTVASAFVGYGPAPDDCAAGRTSRVSEGRPWLANGTCDCPTSSATPTSARDCRVIDSDSDMQPGNTFDLTLDTTPGSFRVTQEQRLRLVNGYKAEDRLYAQREYADVTKVLSCTVDGRPARVEDCPLGTVGPCPAMFNPVEMVRILPHQGCAEIRERENGWFRKLKPEYPGGCPAQVSP